jgi:fatty-acyl-CoA synthase
VTIQDRSKDLVKSGGEWISSVALENALVAHPAVQETVVIGVPHPRWDERPLAVIVPRPGRERPSLDEVREFLAPHFAKWWLPDAVVFVDAIPRTGTGKYQKSVMRAQFRELFAAAGDLATAAGAASPQA